MHFAISQGVPVKLCAYISHDDLAYGRLDEDTCVASAKFSVDSSAAHCGKPEERVSSDEIMIRKVIENSINGFNGVDQSVERIRLSYLVKYPIPFSGWLYRHDGKSKAIRKIKDAIECIIPRTDLIHDLKTHYQYFQSTKLKDDDENFEAWLTSIQHKL